MDITLLDGSIGQELVKRSGAKPTPLWSTTAMYDHPSSLQELHSEYFQVGATVATTNTYPILQDRLDANGCNLDIRMLWDTAITAAKAAARQNGGGLIAGSVGPLIASYRPDIFPSPDQAQKDYSDIVKHLADKTDFLLLETVSSLQHAEGLLRATDASEVPVWLCVSVDDFDGTKLRSGEAVKDLEAIVTEHRVDAVLVNCSRPEVVSDALFQIKLFGVRFGAYANGFTEISKAFLKSKPTVDALENRIDLGPREYADIAMDWISCGASIVGGCCEIGPGHIRELAIRIRAAGHVIV
ncbi:MAG: homocysteine S-methyltransferase family protein [Alphaproteobacteria bacterium]